MKTPVRRSAFVPVLLAAALACLLPLAAAPAQADAPVNTITAIRSVTTGRFLTTYDITVTSTAAFPMGNAVVTLNIGGQEFVNSSYAPGGTLNSLVFSLTRSQFLSLKNGASVLVYYGADNAALPAAQWNFGSLNLSLLNRGIGVRPVAPVPVAVKAPVIAKAPVTGVAPAKTSLVKAGLVSSHQIVSPQKDKK